MEHLKNFQNYNPDEQVNENLIGKVIGAILAIPYAALTLIITNLMNPRAIDDLIKTQMLDIYSNIDILVSTLENFSAKKDVTDTEKKKIEEKLKELKKLKKKYPTLEDYKKMVAKQAKLINYKNRNYLKGKIEDYTPRKMSPYNVVDALKKVSKAISSYDVKGDTAKSKFQTRLEEMAEKRNKKDKDEK